MDVTNNITEFNPPLDSFFLDPVVYASFSFLTFCGSILIFTIFAKYKKLRSITGYLMIIITLIDTATATFVLTPSIYTTIKGSLQCFYKITPTFLQNIHDSVRIIRIIDVLIGFYTFFMPATSRKMIISKKVYKGFF